MTKQNKIKIDNGILDIQTCLFTEKINGKLTKSGKRLNILFKEDHDIQETEIIISYESAKKIVDILQREIKEKINRSSANARAHEIKEIKTK